MREEGKAPERERRDWIIILVILLFGFLCVGLAGQRAIYFAPNWKLNTNMESNIDPNSDFLTNRPKELIEPVDPAILTNAIWVNLYQTPGAAIPTNIIQFTNTPVATASPTAVIVSSSTNTIVPSPTPTNTVIYYPPPQPTNTKKPPPPLPSPTNTPIGTVDLQITKTDGVASYAPSASTTYTIIVTNAGPDNATGATVNDIFPAQINSVSWACAATGGATCTTNGNGNINDTVNVPVGGTLTYTAVASIASSATGDLINTATVSVPSNYTDAVPGNNSATDTDIYMSSADLQVTKTDGSGSYTPNTQTVYTIVVSNNGPVAAIGATLTDNKPVQITQWSWACTTVSGGAAGCDSATNSTTDFSDTIDLPIGASITYTVTADVSVYAAGTLTNTATISVPAGFTDPNTGNNSATDTDTSTGGGEPDIGPPDGNDYNPGPNGSITIVFSPGIYANGDVGTYDFVYYEVETAPGSGIVDMDWVMIEISPDGSTWIPVFIWGDGISDTNTNMDLASVGGFCGGVEQDNCPMPTSNMYPYPGTGVTVDIDAVPGITTGTTYSWIRISGIGGVDGPNIDAIEVLP